MKLACTGCGRVELSLVDYRCAWPDGRSTVERHCEVCRITWQRQLRALGAELDETSPIEPPVPGVLRLR
jgi:hypothetical protein